MTATDKYYRSLIYGDTVLLIDKEPYRIGTVHATREDNTVQVICDDRVYDLSGRDTIRAVYNRDIESIPDKYAEAIEDAQVF